MNVDDYRHILHMGHFKCTEDLMMRGVRPYHDNRRMMELMEFDTMPDNATITERCNLLVEIAIEENADCVLLAPPHFMVVPLEMAMVAAGIAYLYPFTKREKIPNGQYRHVLLGLVETI